MYFPFCAIYCTLSFFLICVKCKREIPEGSLFCPQCGKKQVVTQRKGPRRGNGTGSVYKRKDGGWMAVKVIGYEPLGNGKLKAIRVTKGGFPTKKAAVEYLPKLAPRQQKKKSTIASLWNGWSTSQMLKLSQNKQSHYRTAYAKIKSIAYIDIDVLTISDLQAVIDEQTPTYYPARDIKNLLSHLYKRAMAQQEVATNLSDFLVLPDFTEAERAPFTEEELRSLWASYGGGEKLTGYILLMIYSGMMPGELFQVQKSMIDWEHQCIVGAGLKTKKRKTTPIVIADMMMPVLRDLCGFSKSEKLIDVRRDVFYKEFERIVQGCTGRKLTPYSCRHTTATALALGDIAPSVIQEVMRHTKFSTTQRYIHVDTAPMLDAVNAIRPEDLRKQ